MTEVMAPEFLLMKAPRIEFFKLSALVRSIIVM
jgi:hypothetical protein